VVVKKQEHNDDNFIRVMVITDVNSHQGKMRITNYMLDYKREKLTFTHNYIQFNCNALVICLNSGVQKELMVSKVWNRFKYEDVYPNPAPDP
jgi:hypothetical protein